MKKIGKIIQQILSGSVLTHEKMQRNYPFLLFIVVLAVFWIGNTYTFMHTAQKINEVEKEFIEATDRLQKMEGDFTEKYKPSRLVEKLAQDSTTSKIKMANNATYKIIVKQK